MEVKGKLAALVGAGLFPEAHRDSGGYMVAGEGLGTTFEKSVIHMIFNDLPGIGAAEIRVLHPAGM